MKVLKLAKQRAGYSYASRRLIDDETTGLWGRKRARQIRGREEVKSGQRTQASCLFIAPELVREMKVRHRAVTIEEMHGAIGRHI